MQFCLHFQTPPVVSEESSELLKMRYFQFLNGECPIRATPFSAGLDLKSARDTQIKPNSKLLVPTDLILEIPNGYCGKIESKSGLALKESIYAFNGTIDSDYRGYVDVLLKNESDKTFRIRQGDRIAQLVLYKIGLAVPDRVYFPSELSKTERGTGGWGSSDKYISKCSCKCCKCVKYNDKK
jgi:dUTP pyrophosphatase